MNIDNKVLRAELNNLVITQEPSQKLIWMLHEMFERYSESKWENLDEQYRLAAWHTFMCTDTHYKDTDGTDKIVMRALIDPRSGKKYIQQNTIRCGINSLMRNWNPIDTKTSAFSYVTQVISDHLRMQWGVRDAEWEANRRIFGQSFNELESEKTNGSD